MRIVGDGHQFHQVTGACRRCGVPINEPGALNKCPLAEKKRPVKVSGQLPDLYTASIPKDA